MDISIKKDPFLNFFFVCLGLLVSVLFVCLFLLYRIDAREIASSKKAYNSLVIAGEMRQSSDDLTKMVRLYTLTGDKKYIGYYDEILAIRNGTAPRPLEYSEIYWDFVLAGKRPGGDGSAISLQQLMREEGFSKKEFALIEESHRLSDKLVSLEIEAMNLMQGKYNNGSGDYSIIGPPNPELARSLVSNEAYIKEKAKIMRPLNTFSVEVKERTLEHVETLRTSSISLIVICLMLSALTAFSMIISVLKSLKAIKHASRLNERLLLNMFPQSVVDKMKEGNHGEASEYEGSALFVHIKHFTEHFSADMLSQLFDIFQNLADEYGIEKIKVIGENFMATAGVPTPVADHQIRIAKYAMALRDSVETFNKDSGFDLSLRCGIASGKMMAGIVGSKQVIYDIWGDAVAMAHLLQESGEVGEIHVSQEMGTTLSSVFSLEERDPIEKNGEMEVSSYTLKGKR